MYRSVFGTSATLCGCASSITPPVRFPAPGTPEACLSTGSPRRLVKKTLTFSRTIGSYRFTCNVDENSNPFQDCLNTMGRLCDPLYISASPSNLAACRIAVNSMTNQMSDYWKIVRKECGQWSVDGYTGLVSSTKCTDANIELQENAYYLLADGSQAKVTNELINSVNQGLWSNVMLRG